MTDASVVIIGGGIMGVSLLYHLTKSGWKDVVLLEKNDLTHGSTWHAAGLCTHFAHNATIQELRAKSVRLYRDILPEETGDTCGFHRSGAMRITCSKDRMDEFSHVAGLSKFTGYPLEILTPQRIAELHPLAKLNGLLSGIYEPDDGHVDPTQATNAMAKMARQQGGQINRYEPARVITRENNKWVIRTDKDTYRADHIVNAAGTWGYEVGQMMGVNVPSVPVLHQYLVTDTIVQVVDHQAETNRELPIIRDPEESWYVRQERDGLILGPYERQAQVWSVDGCPPDFGADLMGPDLDRVEHIIEAAMARIPALETGGIKSVVNGPITFSPDANPLIGPAFNSENTWLLTGSSMGVMEGGGAGWFLAHWMTHGAPPMDALAVDPRRFGQWADRDFRVAKAVECFGLQFGVHYPFEERPAARGIRKSPLHEHLAVRGAVMGAAYGWERPNWFSNAKNDAAVPSFERTNWFEPVAHEVACASTIVALADLSVFSKFEVTGPDTQTFLAKLGANTPPNPGRIGLTHTLTPTGGVSSEFTVTRTAENTAYLTSAAAAEEIDEDTLQKCAKSFDVTVSNVTSQRAVIGIMGPLSQHVLSSLTATSLTQTDFPWLTAQQIKVAGISALVLRVSYIGEAGWELHVATKDALPLFKALETAGAPHGIGYYGAYAMNSMRLEKGYRGWGSDLTTERTLSESGLAYFDKRLNKPAPSNWSMQLFEALDCPIDPFYAHTISHEGRPIGVVTSAAFGHRSQKTLALGYLREPDLPAQLTVEVLGKSYPLVRLDRVPYDPNNLILKG